MSNPMQQGHAAAVIRIEGMSCGHCVKAVQGALAKVSGVRIESVAIGEARIQAGAPAVIAQAIEAIEGAGFEASVPAAPPGGGASGRSTCC